MQPGIESNSENLDDVLPKCDGNSYTTQAVSKTHSSFIDNLRRIILKSGVIQAGEQITDNF